MQLVHPFAAAADGPARLTSLAHPALRRLASMIREWRRRTRSRRELLTLNEHLLKDIGITRFDAQYEATKPFWR